jgi:hypothetical protein
LLWLVLVLIMVLLSRWANWHGRWEGARRLIKALPRRKPAWWWRTIWTARAHAETTRARREGGRSAREATLRSETLVREVLTKWWRRVAMLWELARWGEVLGWGLMLALLLLLLLLLLLWGRRLWLFYRSTLLTGLALLDLWHLFMSAMVSWTWS